MMYLIHLAVWITVYKVAYEIIGHNFLPSFPMILLCAVVTVALSALSRRYFEGPILKYKNATFAFPRRMKRRLGAL